MLRYFVNGLLFSSVDIVEEKFQYKPSLMIAEANGRGCVVSDTNITCFQWANQPELTH